MNRGISVAICAIVGLGLLLIGWRVPAHLRSVEISLIERAGRGTPGVVERGLSLANERELGAAEMMARAGKSGQFSGHGALEMEIQQQARLQPALLAYGHSEPWLASLEPSRETNATGAFGEVIILQTNRNRTLAALERSSNPGVKSLLALRNATNTVLFPPSRSSSGQALDAVLATTGLMLEQGTLNSGLSNAVVTTVAQAQSTANPAPAEEMLLDFLSLSQRMNWNQLKHFLAQVNDLPTLRLLAHLVRSDESRTPALFAAVDLSGQPAALTHYLMTYHQSGFKDVEAALRSGAGGLQELLRRQLRLHEPPFGGHWGIGALSDLALKEPQQALVLKWILYVAGGFLLALALHFARPEVTALERPLQVRGIHFAREFLFALGLLLVMLLVSEPFLAEDSQRAPEPFRPRLSLAGHAVGHETPAAKTAIMNQLSLLTLLLFFVLQGLLYLASLLKLAEIRRQRVPARVRLRLLENEDHLFDAGLYLGFVGTIISLILVSLGVIKPSLMAAYSSTSFGIIFVSIFKIFHLRPLRRKILLEAEAQPPDSAAPSTQSAWATSS
jgi:hypothetical protein